MTEYLRVKQVAALLGIGVSTVWAWVKEGKLPAPVKLSERVTVWDRAELESWVRELTGRAG
ncbi:MAG TPA: AlpA family phage regulatory protein [Gammaproteobacteria bacterium]|nr:AlpA family phage regulatory protein [Gammaproteobacteria bacterium]